MTTKIQKQTYARREFLEAVAKRSAVLAGLVAAAHLPYTKPEVQSFFGVRSAYAQATPTYTININGQLGPSPPGTEANIGQDAYTFDCPAGVILTISVTVVELWAEIGLFAPGDSTSDVNLLTGVAGLGLDSGGTNNPINTTYGPTTASGLYTFAIEDQRENPIDMIPPPETSGTYSISISGPQPLGSPTQIISGGSETLLHDGPT